MIDVTQSMYLISSIIYIGAPIIIAMAFIALFVKFAARIMEAFSN